MKKLMLAAVGILFLAGSVHAANQYNWGTSTGGAWSTPDDTTATVGQVLQIGTAGGATVKAGGAPLSLYPQTKAQLLALTPGTTGQIAYCSDCTNTFVVVATGTASGLQWMGVFNSTPAASGLSIR